MTAQSLGIHLFRTNLLVLLLISLLTAAGTLMVLADWLGRNIAWPWPVSAGLLTAFIGAPWFLWQFSRTVSRQVLSK
ncbi:MULTISPECIES: iron chelate uptake ABC transporter family permease subunit [unclassified Pantoea]|uniref:iron chelate uptake ABC transporter family permease subunit n=1 Tax=unclassified Pantoea TaxID=2630326 RepID=UPI0024773519|nr:MULTISPECIES: iron chelate uptake ABC transporter family permease subunit [unclassified Pantoea]GME47332.1 hypothetical protein ACJ1_42260 [Pantoea sp. QMID1]GME47371.1 hypothetical protein ACJ3_42960 [Pantoea sp. QMID3]GME62316.1 hypothetical protein ACJ4_42840 [Pantoea sp. QMID4]GME63615.1 hypothetical protein ACJ2_42950 [Pantoea sp. QMID2]